MNKIIISLALALALVAGTAAVMTVHPHQAMAAECVNSNC